MAKTEIFTLGLDGAQFKKVAQDLQKEIVRLTKEQKDLKKNNEEASKSFIQNAADLKDLKSNYQDAQKGLIAYNNKQKETVILVDKTNKEFQKEIQTINEANQQNTRLNKIKKDLNVQVKDGIIQNEKEYALAQKINKQIDKNTKFVKENSSAVEQQKMNIGNYSSALDGLSPGMSNFLQQGQAMVAGLKAQAVGLSGARKGLKLFKIALISTGIGAIVVALGLFINYMSKLQVVTDKVTEVFGGLSAALEKTIGFFVKVGGLIKDVATGQKSLTEAVTEGTVAFSKLGSEIVEAYDKGAAIERQIKATKRLTVATQKEISALEIQAEKYKAISDDSTRSFNEREKALQKSIKIEQTIASKKLTLANQELNNLRQLQSTKSALTDEDIQAEADLVIAVNNAQKEIQAIRMGNLKEERMLKQDRLEKDLDILIDGFDNVKKINDKIIESDKTTLEERARLIKETDALGDESFIKQISTLQQLTTANIDANDLLKESNATLLNEKIRALGLSEIGETRLLEVIRERRLVEVETANQIAELALDQAAKKKEILDQEQQDKLDKILEDREIRQEEFELQLEETALNKETEYEQKLEIEQIQYDNDVAIEQARYDEEKIKLKQRLIDKEVTQAEHDKKLEKLTKNHLKKNEILFKQNAEAEKQIAQAKEIAKLNMASSALSQAKGLFKEHTTMYKALAIAEATINTYKAASLALSTYAYPMGGIFAGLAVAQGLMQVTKIAGIKFEKGGLQEIGGKRHSQGGTKFVGEDGTSFEAEKGELIGVMSRQASQKFKAFNDYYTDGVTTNSSYLESGGIVSTSSAVSNVSKGSETELFAKILAEEVNKIQVVNNVNDTEALINDNNEVKSLANI